MPAVVANGIRIETERDGPPDGPPLLLVRGLGSQLIHWPEALVDGFVAAGFHVVAFDNRDIGLSEKLDAHGVPDLEGVRRAVAAGGPVEVPYRLADMAADAFGVLDALSIESAHLLGISMGGMILQLMAYDRPERVRSATIVMSAAGRPVRGPEIEEVLMSAPADPTDREQVIAHTLACDRVWASPGFPFRDDERRALIARGYDRCHSPDGMARQYAAVLASGPRHHLLGAIRVPTLVIHGTDDPLTPIEEGRAIAAGIAGAELLEIEGMGHDLEGGIATIIAGATTRLVRRVEAGRSH